MTKSKLTYAVLVLLSLGFTACQQEDDFAPQEQEVRISATIGNLTTRVTYGDEGATNFVNGDQILVINALTDNVEPSDKRAVYAYNGEEWTPVSNKLVWEDGQTNIFFAYYPATVDFTLPTDQSTPEKLAAADRMKARADVEFGETVALEFEHLMTKVTFRTTLATEFSPSIDKITSLKVVTNETTPQEVTACADGTNYTAIITPYWYKTADDIFVKVYMNEETEPLTVKVPADFVGETGGGFQPGTHYTFNLKVGKDKVTIEQVLMNDFDSPFGEGWNYEEDLN